jgi:hypothetical protein
VSSPRRSYYDAGRDQRSGPTGKRGDEEDAMRRDDATMRQCDDMSGQPLRIVYPPVPRSDEVVNPVA